MYKLYYMPGACPLVPHVALEWAKADYEAVNVSRDKLKSSEFLAINPKGSVPVLQEGDWILTQNVAILDYINDVYPAAGLFGSGDAKKHAKSRQWLAFVNADLHPLFGLLFNPGKVADGEQEKKNVQAKAAENVLNLFKIPNEALKNQDYLAGELTIADVYLYVILRWAKAMKLDLSEVPELEKLYQRVEANAGVQSAMKQQGIL